MKDCAIVIFDGFGECQKYFDGSWRECLKWLKIRGLSDDMEFHIVANYPDEFITDYLVH